MKPNLGYSKKVTGYESDYFDSLGSGSYEGTSEDYDANDAKRYKFKM